MEKVSICIPAYKDINALDRLLQSILEQTYNNYEVVISDDSPDDSLQPIIAKYSPSMQIYYERNKVALGSPGNWNKSINMASGKYIKLMHNDDCFSSPCSLQKFVDALEKDDEVMFAFSSCYDRGEGIDLLRRPTPLQLKYLRKYPDVLLLGNFVGAPSAVIYRNAQPEYYDEQLIWKVDVDFYVRFLRKYPTFVYIDEPLINIGISVNQISRRCEDNSELIRKEESYIENKLSPKYPLWFRTWNVFRYGLLSRTIKMLKKA
ncbi:glycosyltransferase [Bacteroidales bacterium OttesenSCG-928-M11]|nr:glycosyltransferase [Bacteroidales bacterium OttesenSCG-928-M11]